jgi:hypothetical protein
MKPFLRLLFALSLAGAAAAAAAEATPSALYSFRDICRLAAQNPFEAPAAEAAEPRIRLAAAEAAEPRFLVSPLQEPARWALVLAGLAAAGWVAHRRLGNAF